MEIRIMKTTKICRFWWAVLDSNQWHIP